MARFTPKGFVYLFNSLSLYIFVYNNHLFALRQDKTIINLMLKKLKGVAERKMEWVDTHYFSHIFFYVGTPLCGFTYHMGEVSWVWH